MADLKISQLTSASTPLAGTEVVPIVQSGTTKKVPVSDLTAGRPISATAVTASTGNFIPATAGKGMDFSAVTPGAGATNQIFADYQEGSGTATRSGFTEVPGGGTITSTYYYTKIGRTVFMNIRLTCSGGAQIAASAAASAAFTDLPFTVASGQQATGTWMDTTGYSVFGPTSMIATTMYVGGPGFALGSNSYSFSAVFNV